MTNRRTEIAVRVCVFVTIYYSSAYLLSLHQKVFYLLIYQYCLQFSFAKAVLIAEPTSAAQVLFYSLNNQTMAHRLQLLKTNLSVRTVTARS
jgi:hypothetical protein